MSNSIRLKKSGVAGKVPQLTDLSISELSYNYTDGVLYGKRTSGGLENIVEFAGSENHHLLKHLATPGIPVSGYSRFYAKSDDNLYLFTSSGFERKLWHSGNQGPGSGLDADTLDGEHASAFALSNHSHSNHVLKAGDTMTGNLSIVKMSGSSSAEAYYRVAAQDSSSDAIQVYSKVNSQQGSGQYSLFAIATHSSVPLQCNMLYFDANSVRGLALHIGDDSLPNISIKASTGSLGNATHVYVQDTDGWLRRVPVSSFGGGSGTVTSVGLSMPNIFSVSGSPVTSSGTLTASLVSQTKNFVLVAPQFANGVPAFRKLTADDMPDLSAMYDNYYSWNMKVDSGTVKQILKTGSAAYTNAFNGINLIAGNNITLAESNVSGVLGITINASGSGGSYDNYEAWTIRYPVDGVTTSTPVNSVNSAGAIRAVRFAEGVNMGIVAQSEANNTLALTLNAKITHYAAVLSSNYTLTNANYDYNVLTLSNIPAGTYLVMSDVLGRYANPASACTIIARIRSSTGTNYLSTCMANIANATYNKGNMQGTITLSSTTTLYLTARCTIASNGIYASCGYGNNATGFTLVRLY
jgi:hypothetical protein